MIFQTIFFPAQIILHFISNVEGCIDMIRMKQFKTILAQSRMHQSGYTVRLSRAKLYYLPTTELSKCKHDVYVYMQFTQFVYTAQAFGKYNHKQSKGRSKSREKLAAHFIPLKAPKNNQSWALAHLPTTTPQLLTH